MAAKLRLTMSALEASIVPKIEGFLNDAANELKSKKISTPEEGNRILAEAIGYGIAQAFGDSSIQTAFKTGILDTLIAGAVPPVINTAGVPASTMITAVTIPRAVPNPKYVPSV